MKTNNQKEKTSKTKKQLSQQNKPIQKVKHNRSHNYDWYAIALISLVTFAVYYKALGFSTLFYWDDSGYIKNNNDLNHLNWDSIKLFFSSFYLGNYHPLTIFSWAIDNKIGSGDAFPFHLNNILLHLLNTYLVFVLIKRISPKNNIVALITAGLFAIHPMHVESVAWISERKDVLYSFFFILSLITYTSYLKSQKTKHLIYAIVFFIFSCLSKSAAVVLPLVMLLLDYYLNRKLSWRMILEKAPFFIISLIFGIVAVFSQKSVGVLEDWAPKMNFPEHMSVVAFSFVSYLYKAIIPIGLSAIYAYPREIGRTLPFIYYLSVLLAGLLLFFVWYSRRWGKEIVFGFLFFVITIILVLQFFPVGSQTMADRYTYIPYIGIFFMMGKAYERFFLEGNSKKNYRKYSPLIIVLVFIILSIASFGRVKVWENDGTLFSDVIDKSTNSSIAYLNRGSYYKYYAKEINKMSSL